MASESVGRCGVGNVWCGEGVRRIKDKEAEDV